MRIHTIEHAAAAPPLLLAREAINAMSNSVPQAHLPAEPDTGTPPPRARDVAQARAEAVALSARASLLPDRAVTAAFEPLPTAERGSALASSSPSMPPSVSISIGRVEVRAATPSAPPAAAAKATRRPVRLDEYLAGKERAR